MRKAPEWNIPCEKFHDKFGYSCNIPSSANIFSFEDYNRFCALINKSIDDNFDYTIAEYGTIPSQKKGMPEIIID